MTDGDILLAAVIRDPADTHARLVYADWLDEQGRPGGAIRAAFIRAQCAGEPRNVPLSVLTDIEPFTGGRPPHRYGHNTTPRAGVAEVGYGDRTFTYRRGFVEAVSLPLAAFVGELCGRCNGTGGVWFTDNTTRDCPKCRGTGYVTRADVERVRAAGGSCCNRHADQMACDCLETVGGCAAELFRRHPVTSVTIDNKAPTEERSGWRWYECVGLDGPDTLPPAMFQIAWEISSAIPGWTGDTDRGMVRHVSAPTRDDAIALLSRACVAFGRRLAGLPPLPEHVPANLTE